MIKERPIWFNNEMVRLILAGRKTQTRRVIKINGSWECPYGKAGERLWVREDFYPQDVNGMTDAYALYRADNPDHHGGPWKPGIHMPRWASRIILEVVSVRVERVQDISRDDIRAEGVGLPVSAGDTVFYDGFSELHSQFAMLWDSKYKNCGHGWIDNPLVWVIEFKVAS